MRIFISLSFLFCIASFGALAAPVFTGPKGAEVVVIKPPQTTCPAGYYFAGPTTCQRAPAGYYVPSGTAAKAPIPCPIGYYGPLPAATTCFLPPVNTYVPTTAATAPLICPAYTMDQTIIRLCWRQCPPDSFYTMTDSRYGIAIGCFSAPGMSGVANGATTGM